MKSNHVVAMARFDGKQFVVTLKEGEFPLELALDALQNNGLELLSMAPHVILEMMPQDGQKAFATQRYLLVLRKTGLD